MTSIRSNAPRNTPVRPKEDKPEAKTEATPQSKPNEVDPAKAAAAQPTLDPAKKDAFAETPADAAQPLELMSNASSKISAAPTSNATGQTEEPTEAQDTPVDLASPEEPELRTTAQLVTGGTAAAPESLRGLEAPTDLASTEKPAIRTAARTLTGGTAVPPSSPLETGGLEQPVELGGVTSLAKPNVLLKAPEAPNTVSAAATPEASSVVPETPLLNGQQRAQQEVDVKTVADDRAETETLHQNIKDGTNQKTQEIFSMADGSTAAPPGVSVTKRSDNEVELVRKDEAGNELERTYAKRNADGTLQLDSRSFKDNTNQRDVVEVLADGSSSVKSASWQSTENQSALNTPSFEQLQQSRERTVTFSEQRIGQKDADGNWVNEGGTLSTDAYTQTEGAVKGSQTSYSSQQGLGGVDNKLKGNFADQNGTVDRATTHTYTVHPPGEDGTQPKPEYERIERFSQGDAQATSYVNAELSTDARPIMVIGDGVPVMTEDNYVDYESKVGTQNHNLEDLNNLRSAHKAFWGDHLYDANDAQLQDQLPKRWLAENKDDANTYESQTFVEGAPNATITTRRELQADNTVTETYAGKTFSPDPNSDDLVDVKGTSTTQYGEDGKVAQSSFQRTQADGSVEDGTYRRTREQTAQGTLVTEHAEGNVTQADGKKSSSIMDRQTRETETGRELVRSSQAAIEDGRRVTHELSPDGEKLLSSSADGSNAVEITDASQFTQPFEENLAATAAASNLTNLKGLTDSGGIFSGVKEAQATQAQALLGGKLDTALAETASAYKKAGVGLGVGGGAIGAGAAAASMMDAVRTKNNLAIASASIGLAGAAADMGSAASVMKGALGKFGGMLGIGGAALGNVSSILGGVDSIMTADKTGLEGQKIKGITNVVTGGLGLAALAAGSPLLALGLGVAGVGINAITELITDDQHQIANLKINDPNYRPSLEEAAPPEPDPHAWKDSNELPFDPMIGNLW